jgi:T5SS/PEP-CTERM-associated repeat protein
MVLGRKAGSVGTVAVRNDADLRASRFLDIGSGGAGTLVQTGGTVTTRHLTLGRYPGSFGQYTIEAGVLQQSGHFHNALEGAGNFTVIGPGATISIAGDYRQNGLGVLNLVIEDDPGNLSRITIGGQATFESGSMLQVLLEQGFVPQELSRFTVLRAARGIVDQGLALIGNSADWICEIVGDDLVLTYAAGAGTSACTWIGNPTSTSTSTSTTTSTTTTTSSTVPSTTQHDLDDFHDHEHDHQHDHQHDRGHDLDDHHAAAGCVPLLRRCGPGATADLRDLSRAGIGLRQLHRVPWLALLPCVGQSDHLRPLLVLDRGVVADVGPVRDLPPDAARRGSQRGRVLLPVSLRCS